MYSWENDLIKSANKAMESQVEDRPVEFDKNVLDQSYCHCASMTKFHSRTFYMASGLLTSAKKMSVRALYAFCRVCDDIIDCSESDPKSKLEEWRRCAITDSPSINDPISVAWTDTRLRYHIPKKLAEQLIDGVSKDIYIKRYETFKQLTEYCYGVASTVGLMAMHIIGYSGKEAIPYAIRLGIALQLNNILRDIGEDWRTGRIYLPQEELRQFGLTEEDFVKGQVDNRWREFMKFQIERNRRIYEDSMQGIGFLDSDGRFAISAAAELYRAILEDIEANDFDIFNRRAYVSNYGKLCRLPGIWWRSKTIYNTSQFRQTNKLPL